MYKMKSTEVLQSVNESLSHVSDIRRSHVVKLEDILDDRKLGRCGIRARKTNPIIQ